MNQIKCRLRNREEKVSTGIVYRPGGKEVVDAIYRHVNDEFYERNKEWFYVYEDDRSKFTANWMTYEGGQFVVYLYYKYMCYDCGTEDMEEYAVTKEVWREGGLEPNGGFLCVPCLEKRLGRELVLEDISLNIVLGCLYAVDRFKWTPRDPEVQKVLREYDETAEAVNKLAMALNKIKPKIKKLENSS